jgi:D-lactate dehydrogenase
VNAAVIDALQELGVKLVALRSAGYNNVDIRHAFGKVHVVHVPAYSPYAVAEHAMAMLLTSVRRIHKAYNRTREFNFSLNGLTGFDFHGKTVGVIGTGEIGRIFIDICRGFGMKVIGADLFPNQALVDEGVVDEYVKVKDGKVDYNSLYAQADFISLHAFLNEESRHMINDKAIGKMKDGVIFVNTGRGGLVDTEALIRGIVSGKIGAAGIDVYEEENENVYKNRSGEVYETVTARLTSFPNVVVTSHQAFFTEEALGEIARVTLENATAYANGTEFVARSVVTAPEK